MQKQSAGTQKTLAAALAELGRSPAAYRLSDGRLVVSPFKAEAKSVTYWADVIATLKNSYGLNVAFVPTFLNFRSYASAFVRGHEKVPVGGQVVVPTGGQ